MIPKNCKILFLLIAFCAIEKDIVFAENTTTSVQKIPKISTASKPVTPSKIQPTIQTSSTTTSAPGTSPSTNSMNEVTSPTTTSPTKTSSTTSPTTTKTTPTTTDPSINVTEDDDNTTDFIPDYLLLVEEEEPISVVDIDIKKFFHYVIYDEETGVPCTLTKMGITLTVPYETENKTIATTTLKVPLDANVTGTCEENLSLITIGWQETDNVEETVSDGENTLTMRFIKDGDIYYIQYLVVTIVLDNNNFPNATGSIIKGNSTRDLKLFPSPVNSGMHICNETKEVHADPISVQIHNASIIAFNNQTDFSAKHEAYCATEIKDEESNGKVSVGVYVGAISAGLILIGLIILIIKRSTRNITSWNLLNKRKNHEGC